MNPVVETTAMWIAIAAYAVATTLFVLGTILGKGRLESSGLAFAAGGAFVQMAAIAARWVRIGHGPYLGFYEVATLLAFMAVCAFLFGVWRFPGLRVAGVALLPIVLLINGGSLLVNREAMEVTGSLVSFWLVVHVLFANLAFGAYAFAFVLAVAYLMKESKRAGRWSDLLARFPEPDVLDELTFRVIGAGFVFQTVMIVSGAIWANEAWGRYWGWDPMETWSLLSWAIYAIYLHLTLTLGWRGKRAAWVAIASLGVILFSLLGVPVFYNSVHGAYLAL